MNYKSQLRAWGIDRALEYYKVACEDVSSIDDVITTCDRLIDYAYIPREDLEATAKDMFELCRNAAPNQASLNAIIGTLERIADDRQRDGIDRDPLAAASPPNISKLLKNKKKKGK